MLKCWLYFVFQIELSNSKVFKFIEIKIGSQVHECRRFNIAACQNFKCYETLELWSIWQKVKIELIYVRVIQQRFGASGSLVNFLCS